MIQGGDPTGTGRGGESAWGGRFNDEIDAKSAVYQTGYKAERWRWRTQDQTLMVSVFHHARRLSAAPELHNFWTCN
jgi:cyclophilin family peptidyl-prolyl cis-trans isomerase